MPEEFSIRYSSRRRGISATIDRNGNAVVLAPEGVSESRIRSLFAAHPEVFARLRRRFETRKRRCRSWRFRAGETFPLLGKEYPLRLTSRLLFFDGAFLVPAGEPEEIKAGIEQLYRRMALRILERKAGDRAAAHGFELAGVGITGAETRWGSCSSSGKIHFSWKLLMRSEPEIDYVVCHELAHLREMNHSPRFWAEVERLCPEWRLRRRMLREGEIQW